jgi:hypothetical protein
MRKLRTILIGGVVAVAATGAAVAASEHIHVMKVDLPDGAVAQIHYTGDVAPKVDVVSGAAAQRMMAVPIGFDDVDAVFAPFAQMDMIMARMEQQHRAMMQQIAQMSQAAEAAGADAPTQLVSAGPLPPGAVVHYSFYSSTSGKNGCTQTVEWRSDGSGKQPQVTRASSGDCDAIKPSDTPSPAAVTKPAAPEKPTEKQDDTRFLPGRST